MIRGAFLASLLLMAPSAYASECAAGRTVLRADDGREFRVAAAGSETAKRDGVTFGRFVLKGSVEGRPAVVESQKLQGSSATETSYEGDRTQGGKGVKWLKPTKGIGYADGDDITVHGGPLDGRWTFACGQQQP